MTRQFLCTDEAARFLGLAKQTLHNFRFQGRGPAYCRLGRRVAYYESDLLAWANKNRIDPESRQLDNDK